MNIVRTSTDRALEILLVEDNLAEVRLARLAILENKIKCTLSLATDGEEAMEYLRYDQAFSNRELPDLILLDLNLPKKSGIEVLSEIKSDDMLKQIPVVILSSSKNPKDITSCYRLHANCYIIKPYGFDDFVKMIDKVINYWSIVVTLAPMEMMISKSDFEPVSGQF